MAILFSKVSLKADDSIEEFLIGGAPSDEDELSGWAPYDDFIESLTDEAEIEVYVESYLYGEGETGSRYARRSRVYADADRP